MPALTFRAKLVLSHVVLVFIVVGATVLLLNRTLGDDLTRSLDARLEQQAKGAVAWVAAGRHPERIAVRLGPIVDARVTIYNAAGRVIGDSEPPADEEAAAALAAEDAPEVRAAFKKRVGKAIRTDERGRQMRFVAVPASDGMVLRLGVPLGGVVETLGGVRRRLIAAAALAGAAALLLGLLAARLATRPLRAMRESATRIAAGDYDIAVATPAKDDFGALSRSLASLAAQLRERIGELTAQRDRLRRLETVRRDFVANVSHELRTPVTAIGGFAETLLRGGADGATQREFLETIHRHAGRIGRLVDDLLVLADLEARPAGQVTREPVPLAAVARAVARTVAARAAERKVTITVAAPDDVVAVGDPGAVEQILENLVDNAVKYGKDGGTVRVEARRDGDRTSVLVRDDGPGIAAEHLPRLFERFYRVEPGRGRDRGGTGLGLAIVKHLAESMDGTVRATSTPGAGTTFEVDLPAASHS